MRNLSRNALLTGLLSGIVVAFTKLIEAKYLGGLMSPVGAWIIPPLVGAIAAITLVGPLWGRAIYCFLIFPTAMVVFRAFLMVPPRDAESDAFLLAYTIGLGIYSIFGMLIAWLGAQYFSTLSKEK